MRSITKLLTATMASLTLAGCANMNGMSQSLTELTTSSLVGTWVGEYQCAGKEFNNRTIISFKQSPVPLIAEGNYFAQLVYPGSKPRLDHLTIQLEGEMSLTGNAHFNEKAWVVKPSGNFYLAPWSGKRTAPTIIDMEMKYCGVLSRLTKVSDEYITELNPEIVFKQYGHLLSKRPQ